MFDPTTDVTRCLRTQRNDYPVCRTVCFFNNSVFLFPSGVLTFIENFSWPRKWQRHWKEFCPYSSASTQISSSLVSSPDMCLRCPLKLAIFNEKILKRIGRQASSGETQETWPSMLVASKKLAFRIHAPSFVWHHHSVHRSCFICVSLGTARLRLPVSLALVPFSKKAEVALLD